MEPEEQTALERGGSLTPAAFAARLRLAPPDALELPDRVTLTGAALAAFLESGHFPFGQYRIGGERFFVTPSVQIDAAMLERRVQTPAGERIVGDELLVWRPVSFRIAAGTASEERAARPFVGPSGARAYVWLGRPLPGGPLVLRDANNGEERVPVPEALQRDRATGTDAIQPRRNDAGEAPERPTALRAGNEGKAGEQSMTRRTSAVAPSPGTRAAGVRLPAPLPLPPPRPVPPALLRAEQALRAGGSPELVEVHLRQLMACSGVSGDALARAGRLWQELGRLDIARAAYTRALEHGCVEGALGLSCLAEAAGEGIAAAARPLDEAIARNLRSPDLHARYADLLERAGQGVQADWHRRQVEERQTW